MIAVNLAIVSSILASSVPVLLQDHLNNTTIRSQNQSPVSQISKVPRVITWYTVAAILNPSINLNSQTVSVSQFAMYIRTKVLTALLHSTINQPT